MKINDTKKSNVFLWAEKYRPTTVEDILLPSKFKTFFNKIIKDGEMPNLLLASSTAGSGKSSLAKALCRDMNYHYQYINVSSESGIDTLRSQIKNFATVKTLDGKPKVVIMDEFDGATPQLQAGLRAFIEEFHKTCRFIFTCNYISKIIKPLQEGRVMVFDFDMSTAEIQKEMKPKVFKRVIEILEQENVDYNKATIAKIVDAYYPNIRSILSLLQKYSAINGIIDENVFNVEKLETEFFDLILNKKFEQARKYIIEKNTDYGEIYSKLYNGLIPLLPAENKPQAIILIADYQYKHAFAIDPEITFAALLIELMAIL